MSVVFLCVGAAKAGTSWLHRQLSGHPECHFRALKELHYFNALDGGFLKREYDKHKGWQDELRARLAAEDEGPTELQARRLTDRGAWLEVLSAGQEDVDAYLGYLQNGAGRAKVVGEMTPAYALLSKDRLTRMAGMAPDTRFLYLLRDPVERLWSHVRMIAGRRDPSGEVNEARCRAILNRTIGGEETQIVRRADYAGAIERLTAAIPPAKLLIDVFEEVIAGAGLHRICDFLGIRRIAADPDPVYEGRALEMTSAQRSLATKWLAPQYAAAEAVLGRRPATWAQGGFA